jgi:uncharacterized lipoprotein YbaY
MPRPVTVLTHLLAVLAVLTGCESAAEQPLPVQIDAVFQEAHADAEFNGTVLVTRDGVPIYQASFGLADRNRLSKDRRR